MNNSTHFFLGANSGLGFQSLFDRFTQEEERFDVLVLKGGPGAGKSTFMKRVAAEMERKGEAVEYLHCSGDPESLDGVLIPRIRTAVLDGTAPHVVEPRYPAAVDRYVNLGQFYDITAAKQKREEIILWSEACSEAYRRAYRTFGAARQMEENGAALACEEMNYEKLVRRTAGIISREIRGKGDGKPDRYRFLGSISHCGFVNRFDSAVALGLRTYELCDSFGLSAPVLREIHSAARERRYSSIVCPDPEHMDRILHLLIPELGVAFLSISPDMECDLAPYRRIHLDAMLSHEHMKKWRGRLRFLRKMSRELREEGIASLKEAKAAHDTLEGLYHPYVDFSGVDALTEYEMRRINSYL